MKSILNEGLLPQIGANSEWMYEEEDAVFLFKSLEDMKEGLKGWMNLIFEKEWELVSFQIDLPNNFPLMATSNTWEMKSLVLIPPMYIRFLTNERVEEDESYDRI